MPDVRKLMPSFEESALRIAASDIPVADKRWELALLTASATYQYDRKLRHLKAKQVKAQRGLFAGASDRQFSRQIKHAQAMLGIAKRNDLLTLGQIRASLYEALRSERDASEADIVVKSLPSVDAIDREQWEHLLPGEPENWDFYRAVEHSPPPGFRLGVIGAYASDRLLGVAPTFRTAYRLDTPLQGRARAFRRCGFKAVSESP